MKVLFLGYNPEINIHIKNVMTNFFPKIQMVEVSETMNLMELMTISGPFSFVVLSIDNMNTDTSKLYESINDTLGQRPFIFIGSPNSVKSFLTDDILNHSTQNFIVTTPLKPEDLQSAVNNSIAWVEKEEFEESILEFTRADLHKIRIRNFYLFKMVPYDVYLELTPTKFAKIITKNKPYSHQIIQTYSRKYVKNFYLKKDEYLKFLDTSIKNLIKIYIAKLSDKKKHVVLHLKTIFFIHQYIKILIVSEDILKITQLFINSSREIIKSNENICQLLEQVSTNPNMTFAEHSLATSYVGEAILFYLGWTADLSREKILLSSILQDVAINNDDMIKIRSLNDPRYKLLSEEDQKDYKNHPQQAAQISTFFSGFSDVHFILSEQHEAPTGDGFPNGINSSSITTVSCVFIIASTFASRFAESSKDSKSYREIVKEMKLTYNTGNFKEPLAALEKLFK